MISFKCWTMYETKKRIKKYILDECLIQCIWYLVTEGVTSVQEVKRHLSVYVKNDIFGGINLRPRTNKRYYPQTWAIHNHVFFKRQKLKKSLINQEALQEIVDEWKRENPTTSIYFQPKCSSSTDDNTDKNSECETNVKRKSKSSQNSLLFVYQEPWQKRLLLHYGIKLVLLDATCQTTVTLCRYSF